MLFPLIFLFTVVPMFELFLLIQVGSVIGAWNTVGLVFITGIAGAFLARSQGRAIMMKVQSELAQGGVPADSMLHGLMVFVGGLLLVTPGIVTDLVGFCLVIPVTRWIFLKMIKSHFKNAVAKGNYKFQGFQGGPGGGGFRVYTHTSSTGWTQQSNGVRDVVDVSSETLRSGHPPKEDQSE